MKRFISLFLSVVIITTLTGCSEEETPNKTSAQVVAPTYTSSQQAAINVCDAFTERFLSAFKAGKSDYLTALTYNATEKTYSFLNSTTVSDITYYFVGKTERGFEYRVSFLATDGATDPVRNGENHWILLTDGNIVATFMPEQSLSPSV